MNRNVGIVTSSAPPITRIRVGSQLPAKSRKPTTFAGFAIPEMARPRPKIVPESKAAIIRDMATSLKDVVGKVHGEDGYAEEHRCGDDGAFGEAGDATETVAAGAAGAQPGAETNQETGYHEDR